MGVKVPNATLQSSLIDTLISTQPIILIDEISMIGSELWYYLCELKRLTNCTFILFGDYRQSKPCEPGYFLDHPCVMYLTRSNRTELSKIHRYDNALLEVSDFVWDNGYLPKDHIFGAEECRKSIAFHRSKIDEVNHMWNLRETPDRFIQSNQWNIYVELPVVCRKSTSKDNKDFQCRNNEEFTVVRFTKKRFLCIVKLQTFLERR